MLLCIVEAFYNSAGKNYNDSMAYPEKLGERTLSAVRNGHSKAEVREMFGLGTNTLRAWENLKAETGSLKNRVLNHGAYKIDSEKLLRRPILKPQSGHQPRPARCRAVVARRILPQVADRLKEVMLENMPWDRFIKLYNTPETLSKSRPSITNWSTPTKNQKWLSSPVCGK